VNVSGGEPRDVQDRVMESPAKATVDDDDGGFITGAAV